MALVKITNKEFLNNLISLAPTILSEYEGALTSLSFRKPMTIEGWKLLEVYQQGVLLEGANSIPTLKSFIENLPSNIYPVLVVLSSIRGGDLTDNKVHSEDYPVALHRYHIPLHACNNAFLKIQEDDGSWSQSTWEEGFAYEFENPQNKHFLSHNDILDDRVIIILDVFEDVAPTQDELDLCYSIASSFIEGA
jgi:hypothetical protein